MGINNKKLLNFKSGNNVVEEILSPVEQEKLRDEVIKPLETPKESLKSSVEPVSPPVRVAQPKKERVIKKKERTVEKESVIHVSARISDDFDRAISKYCIEQNLKRNSLVISAVSRIVGYECEPTPLAGENCKVIISASTKTKSLYGRVTDELKKMVKLYVFDAKEHDPDFSESYLVAQAVADYIGYKKKMKLG